MARAPAINTALKVQWPLCFAFNYVQPITQCYRRKTVEKVPLQQFSHYGNTTIRVPPTFNYCLESAAAITLHFQLFSAPLHSITNKEQC